MTLETHIYPGALQYGSPSFRRNRSAHLRQGELTSACGALTILMAMVVLGVATKAYVRRLRATSEGDLLASLWSKAQETFFMGADHEDMLVLLDTVERYVHRQQVAGSMRQVMAFTLARLAKNDVVALGFGEEGVPAPSHWALAVGTESRVLGLKRSVTGVLCLDASVAAPALSAYNARLDVNSPKRGARQLHYRGAEGQLLLLSCTSAIALSRR